MSAKENADYLMKQAQAAGITDHKELANFMGQMQVESGGFKRMEENLNYSGERLLEVFEGRNGINDLNKANKISKGGAESVANAIYGGEWGRKHLGNTEPGDGWKYRGRGYIQLTGRSGYEAAGAALGLDLINNPDLAADRENAAKIAKWYWENRVASKGHQSDVDKATHDINGGKKGIDARRAAVAEWEGKLEHGYAPGSPDSTTSHILKQGMHGEEVKKLQEKLHDLGYLQAAPDGSYGPATKAAVESFQDAQGITPDGKVGLTTQQHLDEAIHNKAALSASTLLSDPSHPQHALYASAVQQLEALGERGGFANRQALEQAAGQIAFEAKVSGMERIDRVVQSTDGRGLIAVQGELNDPAKHRVYVDREQAQSQPLQQSTQQMNAEVERQERERGGPQPKEPAPPTR